ncbi:MAG: DUF4870 domain-containing protein [Leptolyngbyaceae cyanobacterium MAG.088]|nr:DUF4870 domain-containing protein [Leptolyngbyaceae cyanobacterium MAG.088]
MDATFDSDKRKLLSALSHGSIFLSQLLFSAGLPGALWVISDDPVVKENAKEALNFHLNIWIYSGIVGFLCWFLVGWLFVIPLLIFQWVMPVLAMVAGFNNPDSAFKYPFILRFL